MSKGRQGIHIGVGVEVAKQPREGKPWKRERLEREGSSRGVVALIPTLNTLRNREEN